jgi:hypothetical protein
MKILTWREALNTLNPSPIFVAVADFAEVLAVNGDALLTMSNGQEVKGSALNCRRGAFKRHLTRACTGRIQRS